MIEQTATSARFENNIPSTAFIYQCTDAIIRFLSFIPTLPVKE